MKSLDENVRNKVEIARMKCLGEMGTEELNEIEFDLVLKDNENIDNKIHELIKKRDSIIKENRLKKY